MIKRAEKTSIIIFVIQTDPAFKMIPYITQQIEHIKKLISIRRDRSATDLVLYVWRIWGIKLIVDVIDAIEPIINKNILNPLR